MGMKHAANMYSDSQIIEPRLDKSPTETSLIPFEIISQMAMGGLTEKSTYIINSPSAWDFFWNKAVSHIDPTPTVPYIDFNQYTVIAEAQGQQNSGGSAISIEKIQTTNNTVHVSVKEVTPGVSCMTLAVITNPYQIVKVKKSPCLSNLLSMR